jgi:hypothetical protein
MVNSALVDTILLFAVESVAATAVVGVVWLAVTRRGDDATAPADPQLPMRATLSPSDDPILAALGLPEAESPADLEGRLPGRDQGVERQRE